MAKDVFEMARKAANRACPMMITRYRHASVILDRKGRVIATGVNYYEGGIKTVHSEFHALHQVDVRKLDGAVIVNYARTGAHTILARPCERSCWPILRKLGFKKVIYTEPSPLAAPLWREEFFI